MTVKVTSGYAKEEFHVQDSYLTATSSYLRHLVNKLVLEDAPLVVELEQLPAIVSIYIDYICNGCMPKISSVALGEMGKVDHDVVFERLAACYVFGEEIDDSSFCNSVLTYLCIVIDHGDPTKIFLPGPKSVNDMYRGTPTDSPIRRFLTEVYTELGSASMLVGAEVPLDSQFLLDLAVVFFRKRGEAYPGNIVTPHRALWARESKEEIGEGAVTKEEELSRMVQTSSM